MNVLLFYRGNRKLHIFSNGTQERKAMILSIKPEQKLKDDGVFSLHKASCDPKGKCQGNRLGEGEGYFRTINGSPHFFVGKPGSGKLAGGVIYQLQQKGKDGNTTHVFYAGKNGQPVFVEGKYRLVEAGTMIPSHDPKTFRPNETYPKGLQERAYHRDKSEQSKVRTNAGGLHPALVANTNPDALNGPPILNKDGHVLGGNSRAMSLQLVHSQHPEKAKQLKEYLKKHAGQFGFSSKDIDKMQNPVIVREIDTAKHDESEHVLVRAMNEGFTQSMDPRTMQVAMSRRLDSKAMDRLASDMDHDETLREFLGSSRGKSFVGELARVGIIDDRNRNQYVNRKTGKLNEDGKTLVEKVLVGKVINDADLLANTKPSLVSSLARAVPFMIQAEGFGEGFNIRDKLKDALAGYNKMNDIDVAPKRGLKGEALDAAIKFAKNNMDDMFEGEHAVNKDEATGLLFETLIRRGGPNQLSSAFREYARQAKANPEGQVSMFGTVSPLDVLQSSLTQTSKKSLFIPGFDLQSFLRTVDDLKSQI